MKTISRRVFFGLLGLLGLLGPADGQASDGNARQERLRGRVLAYEKVASMTKEEVDALLAQIQLPGLSSSQYGLGMWRVRYLTPDVDGRISVASGTIIVPEGAVGALPVVSDQHGTEVER